MRRLPALAVPRRIPFSRLRPVSWSVTANSGGAFVRDLRYIQLVIVHLRDEC